MPIGCEWRIFDIFRLAAENECITTDFDAIKRNWPLTGMFNYILAKAMSAPSKAL